MICVPRASTTARSTAFSSSRTLPGQGCAEQRRLGLGRERELPPGSGGVAGEEVVRERQHVLAALAQRRQLDRDDVQPEEEVLAEAAGGHLVAQHAVRRGDDPHVDRPRLGAADAAAPRPPGARAGASPGSRGSISPISSRKSVPPLRALEAAGARRAGAGERALLVAEELALEDALGERLAVDGDERLADALAPVVEEARHQLLAGAALALDQHRRASRARRGGRARAAPGSARSRRPSSPARSGSRPPARSQRFSRSRRSSSSARPTQRAQLVVVERLGDVVEGALAHRRDRRPARRRAR